MERDRIKLEEQQALRLAQQQELAKMLIEQRQRQEALTRMNELQQAQVATQAVSGNADVAGEIHTVTVQVTSASDTHDQEQVASAAVAVPVVPEQVASESVTGEVTSSESVVRTITDV